MMLRLLLLRMLSCSILLRTSTVIVVQGFAGAGAGSGGSSRKNMKKQHLRPSQKNTRPIIPNDSFANLSALTDGIDISPAPNGKGMGTFASVAIIKGDILGEYFGEILTRKQVEGRYWKTRSENKHDRKWRNSRKRRNQGISGDYLFDMGDDFFIDGEDADVSSWCRFANHADPGSDCNVEVRARVGTSTADNDITDADITDTTLPNKYDDGDKHTRLYMIALVDIEKGVELQYDYGEEYWD